MSTDTNMAMDMDTNMAKNMDTGIEMDMDMENGIFVSDHCRVITCVATSLPSLRHIVITLHNAKVNTLTKNVDFCRTILNLHWIKG